jgi:hypothetical protein
MRFCAAQLPNTVQLNGRIFYSLFFYFMDGLFDPPNLPTYVIITSSPRANML